MATVIPSAVRRRLAPLAVVVLLAGAGVVAVSGPVEARLGGGGSFGSRGSRTFSAPSYTPTAPRVVPIERSTTAAPFNRGVGGSSFGGGRPGFFSGGLGRGLIGGFLGAGLFGLLSGSGLFGGMGGGSSLIGLLLQVGLLYLAFRFIMGLIRRQPAFGGGLGGGLGGGSTSGVGGFGGNTAGSPASAQRGVPITIGPEDYQAFEQRLIASQAAYSDNNVPALRQIATSEMAGNFAQELANNDRQGVANKLSNVRLLQGDLSEAWSEGGSDYASVAMRFSLTDVTLEQSTGRVVAGNPGAPQEVTEVWTFARPSGTGVASWRLSAIQQA